MTAIRLVLTPVFFLVAACASSDGGLGTVPPASAQRVAGLRFVCVGTWPDDHFLKHSFVELPDYSNERMAVSRLCSMLGTRASVFEGNGFMRLYVSGRDFRRLAALTYRPEQFDRITACRGAKHGSGPTAERTLWAFPIRNSIRLSKIPRELCESIEEGSFLETAPDLDAWELNLYGSEADKIALCQLASELVDTTQCEVAKDEDSE